MLPVDVDTDDRLVQRGICGLDDGVVGVVRVAKSIKPSKYELETGFQILWGWRCDEDYKTPLVKMKDSLSFQS